MVSVQFYMFEIVREFTKAFQMTIIAENTLSILQTGCGCCGCDVIYSMLTLHSGGTVQ